MTGTAKEQVGSVVGETVAQAKDLTGQVKQQAAQQLSGQTDKATSALRDLSRQLNEGDTSGVVGTVLSEVGAARPEPSPTRSSRRARRACSRTPAATPGATPARFVLGRGPRRARRRPPREGHDGARATRPTARPAPTAVAAGRPHRPDRDLGQTSTTAHGDTYAGTTAYPTATARQRPVRRRRLRRHHPRGGHGHLRRPSTAYGDCPVTTSPGDDLAEAVAYPATRRRPLQRRLRPSDAYGTPRDAVTSGSPYPEASPYGSTRIGTGAVRRHERASGTDVSQQSVGQLVGQVTTDLSTLMRQEIELARAEITAEAKKAGKGAGLLGAAGFVGYLAAIFASLTIMFLLDLVMPLWAAALIVTAVYGADRLRAVQQRAQAAEDRRPEAAPDRGDPEGGRPVGKGPDEIRAEIEATREALSADVDNLTEKVSPARVVERKVDSAKESAREAVSSGEGEGLRSRASTVHGHASSAGSTLRRRRERRPQCREQRRQHVQRDGLVRGLVGERCGLRGPRRRRRRARLLVKQKAAGNPLLAGAVAFGVGYLLSSLLPASTQEQHAAQALKEQAARSRSRSRSSSARSPPRSRRACSRSCRTPPPRSRRPPPTPSATVKETAADAGQQVADEAKSAAGAVKATPPRPPARSRTPPRRARPAPAARRAPPPRPARRGPRRARARRAARPTPRTRCRPTRPPGPASRARRRCPRSRHASAPPTGPRAALVALSAVRGGPSPVRPVRACGRPARRRCPAPGGRGRRAGPGRRRRGRHAR